MKLQFRSVGTKVFMILFITVVLLSAILGFSSYWMSKEIIRGQVGLASTQAIEQAADKLDFLFVQYEASSRQLAVDQTLKSDLEAVADANIDIISKTAAETRIKNKLDALKGSDSRLTGIRLINRLDMSKTYFSSGSSGTQTTEATKSRLQSIVEAGGKPVWVPGLQKGFFESSSEPTITMGRLLQNLNHQEAEYVLLMEIKSEAVTESLANLKIGSGGEVRIVTPEQTIVHAPDNSLLETQSFIAISEEQLSKGESFTQKDEAGSNQLVVFRQLQAVDWRLIGYAPERDFLSAADKLIGVTLYVLIASVLVALAIGYYLYQMVSKPLQKLSTLMEQGERGNLKVRAGFKGKDEIGRLGLSFNKMLEQISLLVEHTQDTTVELLSTAENLSKASRDTAHTAQEVAMATGEIAHGASSLAREAEKVSELAEAIGVQMNHVVELNATMDQSAERVIEVSSQGQEFMEHLVERTESVSRMTSAIEHNSDKLSRSTYSIRNILAPMIEMTKQTNILSLNASIEASRAGAAGKGFVVIAEEIRKLSMASNDSIQNVSAMTEEIQEAIEATVQVLGEVTPMFTEQLQSVKEASSIFQKVSTEMNRFTEEIQNSSASVKELLLSQSQLRDFITNVSSVVQQTNASTEEVASVAAEQHGVSEELIKLSNRLEELSEALKQSLSVFQVEGSEGTSY